MGKNKRNRDQLDLICYTVTDRITWHSYLSSLPYHHVLQSWEWGEFKRRNGWEPERLAFKRHGELVAVAQVLTRRAWPLPLSIMYVPKGPVLDYHDRPLRQAALAALAAHGRQRRAIFIKIDPDVVQATGVPDTPSSEANALGEAFISDLAANGWRFSADQIQFRNTVQLDLDQSESDLLAAMKSKTRYNIRLAERKGVSVRRGGLDDLDLLFEMYAETAQRDQFVIRPLGYYRDAWGMFFEAGLACPLIAYVEDEPIAAVILFCFGDRVFYMYGASRNSHRKKMPNHSLQWHAICWAKEQGHRTYDMWGAPNEFAETDSMWGVWRFKEGFGGQVVRHIGAWDLILSPSWHWIYAQVIPRYLKIWRSLTRSGRTHGTPHG